MARMTERNTRCLRSLVPIQIIDQQEVTMEISLMSLLNKGIKTGLPYKLKYIYKHIYTKEEISVLGSYSVIVQHKEQT